MVGSPFRAGSTSQCSGALRGVLWYCRLLPIRYTISACLYAPVPCTRFCARRATVPSVPGYPPVPARPLKRVQRAACSKQQDPKKVQLGAC